MNRLLAKVRTTRPALPVTPWLLVALGMGAVGAMGCDALFGITSHPLAAGDAGEPYDANVPVDAAPDTYVAPPSGDAGDAGQVDAGGVDASDGGGRGDGASPLCLFSNDASLFNGACVFQ